MLRKFSSRIIRSALFVPSNQQSKLQKALGFSPSVVIPDLEDSVPFREKPKAREILNSKLETMHTSMRDTLITPRVNDLSTEWFQEDVQSILKHRQNTQLISGLMIPKIQERSQILKIVELLETYERELGLSKEIKICPVIQTAKGMVNASSILEAAQPRTLYVAFGADDMLRSMQIVRTLEQEQLEFYRHTFIMNCKAFGLQGLDTPYPYFKNQQGLRDKIEYLKKIGFKGMQAIHPAQVDVINSNFAPSQEEIERAKKQVQAFERNLKEKGRGAVGVDGVMVDVPVYRRAKDLLEYANTP